MTLETLSALCRAATPGPWLDIGADDWISIVVRTGAGVSAIARIANPVSRRPLTETDGYNAEFIAAMRNHAEALIDVARAAMAPGLRNDPTIPGAENDYEDAFSALDNALAKLQEIP